MEEEEELFESATRGKWDEVAQAYRKNSSLQQVKITKSQDTALHLAASDGRTEAVLKLVKIIGSTASKILHIRNDKGNTPLHLAAAIGDVRMCHCLAKQDLGLINTRNLEGETPLFVAALRGKKEAFLCLHFLYIQAHKEVDYILCRKKNGDTILHAAISGEHLGLAWLIIKYYPNLVYYVNEAGKPPLHVLASKHNAFKSGTRLRPFDRLIYRFMIVDKLEEEIFNPEEYPDDSVVQRSPNYPPNSVTCINFFQVIRSFFRVITSLKMNKGFTANILMDEENQRRTNSSSKATYLPKKEQKKHFLPPTYETFFRFIIFMIDAMLIILGFGISRIKGIREKKERHTWAAQILDELVGSVSLCRCKNNGQNPNIADPPSMPGRSDITNTNGESNFLTESQDRDQKAKNCQDGQEVPLKTKKEVAQKIIRETPILIAARKGITEVVDKILDIFPLAVQDIDSDNKNAVLLAVEHRQTDVFQLLMKRTLLKECVCRQVDNQGNSALHLAAKVGDHRPWLIPGAALQMQWEIKWYEFVKSSMPPNFFVKYNSNGETAKDIFIKEHKQLVNKGSEWLTKTSESCSVVATLIATVAFSTSATVPGGFHQVTGDPILGNEKAFEVFAVAALVALCSSLTALIFFLSIITSRFQEIDFAMKLPRRLFLGLISLFISIASMLLSFCTGHIFVLKVDLKYVAYPLYAALCLPVTMFMLAQLSLYFDLARAILKEEPQRRYKHKVSYSHPIHP